jgi:hypothetical protein
MNATLRAAMLAALLTSAGLAACSKPDASAKQIADALTDSSAGGAAPVAASADDPCSFVTLAEVRAAFPGAAAGQRDHSQDEYGMASCVWELPTSKLAVQVFKSTNKAGEEVRGRMLGFLDPLQPGLREKIRYDEISGLGDDAVAVAVKADQAAGILADTAMLGIRRDDRMVVIFTSTLVDGDPETSKQALQRLGKSAAHRL